MDKLLRLGQSRTLGMRIFFTSFAVATLVSAIYIFLYLSTLYRVNLEHDQAFLQQHFDTLQVVLGQTDAGAKSIANTYLQQAAPEIIALQVGDYLYSSSLSEVPANFDWKQLFQPQEGQLLHQVSYNGHRYQVLMHQPQHTMLSVDALLVVIPVSLLVLALVVSLSLYLAQKIRQRNEEQENFLYRLATQDGLTGVLNRFAITERVREDITFWQSSNSTEEGALFLIDIDNFKEVNDTYGHTVGDLMLREVSGLICTQLPDGATVGRLGGDEFLVWISGDQIDSLAKQLARRLVACAKTVITLADHSAYASISVGVALYPAHAKDKDTLLLQADQAMRAAKVARNGWEMASTTLDGPMQQRAALRAEFSQALQKQQIQLYYQPQLDLNTQRIIGAEVLIRWHHPERGILYPNTFIDMVEQSEMVSQLARYVLREGIIQLAKWNRINLHMRLSINLSPSNFVDEDLAAYIQRYLRAYQVRPQDLTLEITENLTHVQTDKIAAAMVNFKQMGLRLSLDDFGTGMSSLSYIAKLAVDEIKIDRSFVSKAHEDPTCKAVVEMALRLCRTVNAEPIAEGIETQMQERLLKAMGASIGQGFLYSKAVTAPAFETLWNEYNSPPRQFGS